MPIVEISASFCFQAIWGASAKHESSPVTKFRRGDGRKKGGNQRRIDLKSGREKAIYDTDPAIRNAIYVLSVFDSPG
jgi:hypothetical protein